MIFRTRKNKLSIMKKSLFIGLLTFLIIGCSDFGDINVDPNNPSTVKTDLLLTNSLTSISAVVGATTGTLYVQYISETQYTESSRYQTSSFDFNGWYSGVLQDLQTIIDLNSNPETAPDVLSGGSNGNQLAVANIMQVYYYHFITDRWGRVPYSEALKGNENLTPAYDAQDAIYADMIQRLKDAVASMDGGTGVRGDIIFGGDMDRWEDFANTLRMRIALRMSEANAGTAQTEFNAAVSAGVITSDVMYPYLAEAANENPWYSRFQTRTDYAISSTLADTMQSLNDMRLTVFANPAPDLDNGDGTVELSEINGMPYGISNAGDITNASISFPGSAIGAGGPSVGQQDAPLPIFTVAEVNFARAEAAARGWGGTAATFYNAGIDASWAQWGVDGDAAALTAYKADPAVAYDANNWREQIGYQKWIALFPQGYEAWSEWRRLGFPALTPAPDPLNNSGLIPVRHAYPTSETDLNKENYDAAVAAQGADELDTNLWWDQ